MGRILEPLSAERYDVDSFEAAVELYHAKGWTDGLPIIPPTEERVARFVEASGRAPGEVVNEYYERRRVLTVEKLAINAVMAGCLPEYFPVVLAIIEAMASPRIGLHGGNASTGGMAVGFVVNGPIRNELGMNYRGNVLGPGNRANSSIGRAVRLAQINVMGSVPGAGHGELAGRDILDRSTMGQPGKYAGYHIVENEEDFPSLLPLHVERGFDAAQSVVTVFPTAGHLQISAHTDHGAEAIVDTIAHYLAEGGHGSKAFSVLVIPPECAEQFVRDGWTKADIRTAVFEKTTRTVRWAKEHGWPSDAGPIAARGGTVAPGDDERRVAAARTPEDVNVVIAGGPAGAFVHALLAYAGLVESKPIR